jgi:hypothetical protein
VIWQQRETAKWRRQGRKAEKVLFGGRFRSG